MALTTSGTAAVGAGDDAFAETGGGAVFATELDGFEEVEIAAAFGCAGCGWLALLADKEFEAGDELG